MDYVMGPQILAFVGVANPSPAETEWSDLVALAVNNGIDNKLNGVFIDPLLLSELEVAARIAGAEAFKRREATFGLTGYADLEGSAIRVARDYLSGVGPLIERYNAGPGIA